MKCKVFTGDYTYQTVDSFNRWAKGKSLAKDVIIHTLYIPKPDGIEGTIAIVVYHPDSLDWDRDETELKPQSKPVFVNGKRVETVAPTQ